VGDMRLRLCAALLALWMVACASPPVDPEGTLERVRGGTMSVGIVAVDPWVTIDGTTPGGVEVGLVEEFAESLGASIDWTEGSEQELFSAMEIGQLDLVIGGIDSENPWSSKIALTHPYLTTQVVIATPRGTNLPDDIAGHEVAVEAHTDAAGVLEKTDADVVLVEDVSDWGGLVAVEDYLVDNLALEESGITLVEADHVMAVRMGENGFMVALERFLLEESELVHRLLEERAEP
jgi:polar amino acid transport system substrate-binding protein